jgi:hypothetical protein
MNTPTQTPQLAQTPAPVQISVPNPVTKFIFHPPRSSNAKIDSVFHTIINSTTSFHSFSLSTPAPLLNVPGYTPTLPFGRIRVGVDCQQGTIAYECSKNPDKDPVQVCMKAFQHATDLKWIGGYRN